MICHIREIEPPNLSLAPHLQHLSNKTSLLVSVSRFVKVNQKKLQILRRQCCLLVTRLWPEKYRSQNKRNTDFIIREIHFHYERNTVSNCAFGTAAAHICIWWQDFDQFDTVPTFLRLQDFTVIVFSQTCLWEKGQKRRKFWKITNIFVIRKFRVFQSF